MCFSSKYDGITNYRLDRMDHVEVIDTPVNEEAIIHSADVPGFTNQAFSMYGGPTENAVLQFSDSLIGVVYDQFGEDTQLSKFMLSVPVGLSYEYQRFVLDARYNIGATDLFKGEGTLRNNVFQLTLGYKFPIDF